MKKPPFFSKIEKYSLNFDCEMSYFAKDMGLWETRLQDLRKGNNAKDMVLAIEDLNRQLNMQKAMYNKLIGDISLFEKDLEKSRLQSVSMPSNYKELLQEDLENFKKLYSRFKVNIMDFSAKWI